jgi:hypothetical protein
MITIKIGAGWKHLTLDLDGARKRIDGGALLFNRRLAKTITTAMIDNLQKRTKWHGKRPGRLRNSIRIRTGEMSKRTKQQIITVSAPYAGYVEEGTKPHDIRMPVGSRGDTMALGWRGNTPRRRYGGYRRHRHPGARPMHFAKDAFEGRIRQMNKFMDEFVRHIGPNLFR